MVSSLEFLNGKTEAETLYNFFLFFEGKVLCNMLREGQSVHEQVWRGYETHNCQPYAREPRDCTFIYIATSLFFLVLSKSKDKEGLLLEILNIILLS